MHRLRSDDRASWTIIIECGNRQPCTVRKYVCERSAYIRQAATAIVIGVRDCFASICGPFVYNKVTERERERKKEGYGEKGRMRSAIHVDEKERTGTRWSSRDFPSLDPLMALALPRPPGRFVPPRVLSFLSHKKKLYTFAESVRRVGRYRAIYKLHVWSRGPPEEVTVLAGELLSCLLVVADLSLAGLLGRSGRSPPSSWQREGKRNPSRGALASLLVEETPPVRSSMRLYLLGRALAMSANESGLAHSELAWSAAKIAELRQRLIGVQPKRSGETRAIKEIRVYGFV